ncbi:MAG: DUF1844 domain-containing protein [Deltaproteobacteria bacterium]|nr:DUF1844 domain-containing protein [Deltaproteobacteria bacterium]
MGTDDKEDQRGFRVHDRRRFTEAGETRDESADSPQPEAEPASPPDTAAASVPPPLAAGDVELNFSTFILSLSTQALAYLGLVPDPISKVVASDLVAARQMIDILGMLREKTKGNLDSTEQGLLDNILYDLRMRYVETARRPPA